MSPQWEGAGLGAPTRPHRPSSPGRTRQPWPLFPEAITCCLATIQNSWLFVYSISRAKLKAQIPNYCIQQHQSYNRWIRKRIFLYLLQDFLALRIAFLNIHTIPNTFWCQTNPENISICEYYFHNSCPLGSTTTTKVIHIPVCFNDEVTKSDLGPSTKGHVHLGISMLDIMTKLCLQGSCPSVLEVLIFPNYHLLQVKQSN